VCVYFLYVDLDGGFYLVNIGMALQKLYVRTSKRASNLSIRGNNIYNAGVSQSENGMTGVVLKYNPSRPPPKSTVAGV